MKRRIIPKRQSTKFKPNFIADNFVNKQNYEMEAYLISEVLKNRIGSTTDSCIEDLYAM